MINARIIILGFNAYFNVYNSTRPNRNNCPNNYISSEVKIVMLLINIIHFMILLLEPYDFLYYDNLNVTVLHWST